MWLLWIPIILIVVVSFVGTIFYFKKRAFFLEHKSFVEFWGIALSILFALFAFLQTQSAMESSTEDFGEIVSKMNSIIIKAEESSKALQNVDSSLSKIPQQMNDLSESIVAFNNVVSEQRDQLKATLNGLNGSILTFKSAVDSMVERFNRRPDIRIDLNTWKDDTTRAIPLIVLVNEGKLLADINIVRIYLPTELLLKVGNPNFKKETEQDKYSIYQLDLYPPEPVIADKNKPKKIELDAILKNENFEMKILVYYRASFGNDGSDENNFLFYKNRTSPSKRR